MQNKHRSPGFRLVSRLSAALYRYRSTVPPASPRPLVPVEVCGVTRDLANLTSCRQMRPLLVWELRPGPDLPRGPVGVLGAHRETSLSAGTRTFGRIGAPRKWEGWGHGEEGWRNQEFQPRDAASEEDLRWVY
ncbi:uncharacterized protein AAEQ78_025301 isoform 2-T3 [Lycaon pictus]